MTHHPFIKIPAIEPDYWTFSIGILGQLPFILTYDELLALPLESISTPVVPNIPKTFEALDTHQWRGVPIAPFLDTLIPSHNSWAFMRATDGYTATLPFQSLRGAFLATEKNGQPLSPEEGFPARLIVPGVAGFKMPKWIARIEIGEQPRTGFWESRGRPLTGEFKPRCVLQVSQSSPTSRDSFYFRVRAYGSATVGKLMVSFDWQQHMFVPFTEDAGGVADGSIQWITDDLDRVQIHALAIDELGASSHGRKGIFAPLTPDFQTVRGLV